MLASQASRVLSGLSGAGATSLRGLAASFSSSSSIAAAAAAADVAPSTSSSSTPVGAHAPRVKAVSMTLVLPDGRTRLPLRALPGSTLASVLLEHASEIPESRSATGGGSGGSGDVGHGVSPVAFSPEGRGAAEAVVEVPSDVAAMFPAPGSGSDERRALEELAVDVKPNSRLASAVVVTEGMEDAVIALAKLRPWATL